MKIFRKVDPGIWESQAFRSLGGDSQRLYLRLLTHFDLQPLGWMRFTLDGLGRDLDLTRRKVGKCLEELKDKGLVWAQLKEQVLVIFDYVDFREARNAGDVIRLCGNLHLLPESEAALRVLDDALAQLARSKGSLARVFMDEAGTALRSSPFWDEWQARARARHKNVLAGDGSENGEGQKTSPKNDGFLQKPEKKRSEIEKNLRENEKTLSEIDTKNKKRRQNLHENEKTASEIDSEIAKRRQNLHENEKTLSEIDTENKKRGQNLRENEKTMSEIDTKIEKSCPDLHENGQNLGANDDGLEGGNPEMTGAYVEDGQAGAWLEPSGGEKGAGKDGENGGGGGRPPLKIKIKNENEIKIKREIKSENEREKKRLKAVLSESLARLPDRRPGIFIYLPCTRDKLAGQEKDKKGAGEEGKGFLWYAVGVEEVEAYRQLYPGVDIEQQYRAMLGWLLANRDRRKTLSGTPKFINSWLSREQNRARVESERGIRERSRRELAGAYMRDDAMTAAEEELELYGGYDDDAETD